MVFTLHKIQKTLLAVSLGLAAHTANAGWLDSKDTGGAAAGSSSTQSAKLEKCSAPLGTAAIIENQDAGWYSVLTGEYRLPPSAKLLKVYVQQSNCFVLVERSNAATAAIMNERRLQNSGELRGGSNFGKGQMVSADYSISPEINFSEANTAGLGGAIGGLFGGSSTGRILGAVAGGLSKKEASTMLTLIDNRSTVQLAASEGAASKFDFGGFGAMFGGSGGGGLGGYTNTPEGKVLASAFLDSYNKMVVALKSYKAQEVQGGLGKGGNLPVGQ